MTAVLLPTKFYLPPTPGGFVARPQLLEKLDEALTCRLTLISAPAGAGKTTLVSAWAQSLRKRKATTFGWLSLDAADNAPERFWEYLLACLEEGGAGLDSGSVLPENSETGPGAEVPAGLVRGLVNLKGELILILDDYHLIQNKEIHAALGNLLEHTPPRLHLVILTRSDPPLELARLRVLGQLTEIRMEQLRFSAQEAGLFLKKSAGVQLTEAEIATLNARAEGWIAGLQMAAISLRGRQDAGAFVSAFAGSHRFVFDYLLEQVLNRQTPEVREFLLKTSVLERLSAPLCEAVAETKAARGLLDTLERDNLFLTPLDDERGWYRYHQLFADLLKLMLEQNHAGLAAELHRRASGWYETQEMIPEALDHALSAGDTELAARLVSENVLALVECDEVAPTLQKIDSLPLPKLKGLPWLSIARAWVLSADQAQKSHQLLDAVEQNLETLSDPAERQRMAGHLAAAWVSVYSAEGNMAETVRHAQLAEALLPADEVAARALNLTLWGDILSKDEHDPAAMPILERGLALALQAAKPHVALAAGAALTLGHIGAGRFREAERICQEALAQAAAYERRTRRTLSAASLNYTLLARIRLEAGDAEKAIQLGCKGLALGERGGPGDSEVLCLEYFGLALLYGGEHEQGLQVLQRAQRAAQKISLWMWQMSITLALDSLLDFEPVESAEVQAQIRAAQESGAEYPVQLKARLLVKENQPEQALAMITEALASLGNQPSSTLVRLLLLRALAFQALGHEKPALAALKQALELAQAENRVWPFVREGKPLEKLLRRALTKSICPEFTRQLLSVFEARHKPEPVSATEPLIEPLSERELEILSLLNGPLSTPEIAGQLVVSANTVRTHIKNIYGKLDVHGRSGAVKRAQELGLLV